MPVVHPLEQVFRGIQPSTRLVALDELRAAGANGLPVVILVDAKQLGALGARVRCVLQGIEVLDAPSGTKIFGDGYMNPGKMGLEPCDCEVPRWSPWHATLHDGDFLTPAVLGELLRAMREALIHSPEMFCEHALRAMHEQGRI